MATVRAVLFKVLEQLCSGVVGTELLPEAWQRSRTEAARDYSSMFPKQVEPRVLFDLCVYTWLILVLAKSTGEFSWP